MIATIVNSVIVIIGTLIGLLFGNKIDAKYTNAVMVGFAIIVAIIGVNYVLDSNDTLGMIVCVCIGVILGEWWRIEDRLEGLGDKLHKLLPDSKNENSTFVEGFVSSTLLFCVGSMAIMGALSAGISHDYTILLSKAVIDGIAAISLSMTLGVGVMFSAVAILIYQGGLTLLAQAIAPYLSEAMVTEMSAVGGVLIICIAINILKLKKIKVANMLPAMFLPLAYQPLAAWLTSIF